MNRRVFEAVINTAILVSFLIGLVVVGYRLSILIF